MIELTGYGFTEKTRGTKNTLNFEIEKMLLNYSNYDLRKNGFYRLMGFQYNFTHILKKYVIKSDYDLLEVYSINKTFIRKNKSLFITGKINYIMEVKK